MALKLQQMNKENEKIKEELDAKISKEIPMILRLNRKEEYLTTQSNNLVENQKTLTIIGVPDDVQEELRAVQHAQQEIWAATMSYR